MSLVEAWVAEARLRPIAPVRPFGAQIGLWPKPTVPEALHGPLFGPVAPAPQDIAAHGAGAVPPLATYAVLDAGKVQRLPDMLADAGIAHRSLFGGAAEAELRDVAPYLVALEVESELTRSLFTEAGMPGDLWAREVGIFLRSRAPIDDLRGLLRRFTRVQDMNGAWYYFRFWEPSAARSYFASLPDRPDRASQWFLPRGAAPLHSLLIPDPDRAEVLAVEADFRPRRPGDAMPGEPGLDGGDIARLRAARLERDAAALADRLAGAFPDKAGPMGARALRDFATATMGRMLGYGFTRRDALFVLLAWELHFGPEFETRDPDGELARICASPGEEGARFEALKARMEVFG